jgi:hypothetical protein
MADDSASELKALLPAAAAKPYNGCKICDPNHWSHRYLFLSMLCFLCFGNYFIYDNPAALQDQFEKVSVDRRRSSCSRQDKPPCAHPVNKGHGHYDQPVHADVLAVLVAQRDHLLLRRLPHRPLARHPVR